MTQIRLAHIAFLSQQSASELMNHWVRPAFAALFAHQKCFRKALQGRFDIAGSCKCLRQERLIIGPAERGALFPQNSESLLDLLEAVLCGSSFGE